MLIKTTRARNGCVTEAYVKYKRHNIESHLKKYKGLQNLKTNHNLDFDTFFRDLFHMTSSLY